MIENIDKNKYRKAGELYYPDIGTAEIYSGLSENAEIEATEKSINRAAEDFISAAMKALTIEEIKAYLKQK